jgi:hypothetical protein
MAESTVAKFVNKRLRSSCCVSSTFAKMFEAASCTGVDTER